MALKKVTKTALIAAHDEIDSAIGIEPPIKGNLSQDKYEKELYDTIIELELNKTEIGGFEKETQEVIAFLKDKYKKVKKEEVEEDDDDEEDEEDEEEEEVIVPVKKGKKAPVVVEEEDDDEDEEDEEEEDEDDEEDEEEEVVVPVKKGKKAPTPVVEEDDDEEEEEDDDDEEEEGSLVDQINACKKQKEYHEVIANNPEFKKDKKRLMAIKSVFSLKKEMLTIADPKAAEKKVTEKKVVVKKEKPAPIEYPAGFAEGDTVSFLNRSGESMSGKLKKYFFHKQSNRYWFTIDVAGKDCYKHVEDVTKGKVKLEAKEKEVVEKTKKAPKEEEVKKVLNKKKKK